MRGGFCPPDLPEYDELLGKRDEDLFNKIIDKPNHTLYQLLPTQSMASQLYHLRHRTHVSQTHIQKGAGKNQECRSAEVWEW